MLEKPQNTTLQALKHQLNFVDHPLKKRTNDLVAFFSLRALRDIIGGILNR